MGKILSKRTFLYNKHIDLGGRLIDFGGYVLPLYYSSIFEEHNAVRNSAGLFDVSHMCEYIISGSNAEKFIQNITVNDISSLKYGGIQYSLMCNHNGGIIDDILIYKKKDCFMFVLNAGNSEKKLEWIKSYLIKNVKIEDVSNITGLIALQGPNSREILKLIMGSEFKRISYYNFIETTIDDKKIILSRTGYTGELGFEIYSHKNDISYIWDKIITLGKNFCLVPAGLGCRDTLRTEMNYMLYGNDIDQSTNPIEAGLGWVTKLKKDDFIGKVAISNQKKDIKRKLVPILMEDNAIPRKNYSIFKGDKLIGVITSGTMSPSLSTGIGMGYVLTDFSDVNNTIQVDIRGKLKSGTIIKGPFYKYGSLKD